MTRAIIQKITIGFGAIYALVGVLGFIPGITQFSDRYGAVPLEGTLLGIFAVNLIHNVAHLMLGGALIVGGRSTGAVITTNRIMTAVFIVLTIASFIAPLVEGVNLNPPDTILHLASALLTGYLGFLADRQATSAASPAR
ncbi:MAG: DUF4383 domain-containing protein [Thermomicrobiales bacterium]